MPYSRPFTDPIPTPKGKLRTLRQAAQFILKLPASKKKLKHWQTAAEAVTLVAEHNGPTDFARIGMMQALNFGKPKPDAGPRRKAAKTYRVIR